MRPKRRLRRVCFVTGTRAEFGLMESLLRAIKAHPKLQLQIIATGMHLDRRRGRSVIELQNGQFTPDEIIPWSVSDSPAESAQATGRAIAKLSEAFERLATDIVLVVGDRVEAFAAATAGHISGRAVAHIHGGDRALGQVDDSLRHAITKLAHIHFPATRASEWRIGALGEDRWRIHRAGSPGIDEIARRAELCDVPRHRFALIVLHPVDANEVIEAARARIVLEAVESIPFERVVIVYPNNDPGSAGIARCWNQNAVERRYIVHRNLARPKFLGLVRDAALLVGNSSSGIIEAASFGTPVVNIGPRQLGRERSRNVIDASYGYAEIRRALLRIWNNGRPRRFSGKNVYSGGAAKVIPRVLAEIALDNRLLRKLITY